MKDEIKVQGVAFGPQPHDWLACQCSAIHAVSALPGKKYILGIPHLRPCDSRPSISGIIITKKVRYHGEKIGSTFPSSCICPTETLRQALLYTCTEKLPHCNAVVNHTVVPE